MKPTKAKKVKSAMLYDFRVLDIEKQFTIQMFGKTAQNQAISVIVNDFNPFFYVKMPDHFSVNHIRDCYKYIVDLAKKNGKGRLQGEVGYEIVEKHKLYGFTGGKTFPFMCITFTNMRVMRQFRDLWYIKNPETGRSDLKPLKFNGFDLDIYESNIPPLLRFFHTKNILPSGWVKIKMDTAYKVEDDDEKQTTCLLEYQCSKDDIMPFQNDSILPFVVCSYDIEAASSHGDFPLPMKTYKKLATQIVDFIIKQGKATKLTESLVCQCIRTSILIAFGFAKMRPGGDISLVYPKQQPSENYVRARIEELVSHSITMGAKEETQRLLQITDMFDRNMNLTTEGGKDTDEDGGEEIDEHPDETVNDMTEEEDISEEDEHDILQNKYGAAQKVIETLLKIPTYLMDEHVSRNVKIATLNECMTREFPPLEGDKVTFIGSTFMRHGETVPYKKVCICLGTCSPVEGTEIVSVETERDLLLTWRNLIQDEDPDIMIGYNLFGFDCEFMFRRAMELGIEEEFLKLSRLNNHVCGKTKFGSEYIEEIDSSKIELASGEYMLKYFKMPGRMHIDMYMFFRRDYNYDSYKLDDVVSENIKGGIFATIQQDDKTILCTKDTIGLFAGDFIKVLYKGFTSDYYNGGQKLHVLDVVPIEGKKGEFSVYVEGVHEFSTENPMYWCMAKDDVSPQEIFALGNGSADDRAIIAKYCIKDCDTVQHLFRKMDAITGYVEMSKICTVPIEMITFRGQGIKLTSYVARKCREYNTLMPDLETSRDFDGFEGAIVLVAKRGMYLKEGVACVDYNSLYPSTIISQNYSHDTKVWSKTYDLKGKLIACTGERDSKGNFIYDNLEGYKYLNTTFDVYRYIRDPTKPNKKAIKTKVGYKTCRWAQPQEGKKGILPSILEELLRARKETRAIGKKEKDPFKANIYDKRQNSYKVTANSLYGQCGARTSTIYEKDIAASTTATGRMMIIYAKTMVETVYRGRIYDTKCKGKVMCNAEYVYGDTDSVFFKINPSDPETGKKYEGKDNLEITIEVAQDVGELCSHFLKPPMNLEYEKTMFPFIICTKKRYAGLLYETNPNKYKELKFMGLAIKRRGTCDYFKDCFGETMKILMLEKDFEKAIRMFHVRLRNLVDGNVPIEKLSTTSALKSDYKKPEQVAHHVLAERIGERDPGNKPKPGDRIKFVQFVPKQKMGKKKPLRGELIETIDYIKQHSLPIDYGYYITNQFQNAFVQFLGLAVEQLLEMFGRTAELSMYRKDIGLLRANFPDLETFEEKRAIVNERKTEELLFADYLRELNNRKYGLTALTKFYSPVQRCG